jgi:hypothetical protein
VRELSRVNEAANIPFSGIERILHVEKQTCDDASPSPRSSQSRDRQQNVLGESECKGQSRDRQQNVLGESECKGGWACCCTSSFAVDVSAVGRGFTKSVTGGMVAVVARGGRYHRSRYSDGMVRVRLRRRKNG